MFVTTYGSSVRFQQNLSGEMQQYVKYGTLLVGACSSSCKMQYGIVGSMHPYVA